MNREANIQFKAAHVGEHGLAFDGDGARVGLVAPVYPDDDEAHADDDRSDGLSIETTISLLIDGNPDMKTLCDRVWTLAYMMPMVEGRPENARELGAKLGCSHVAALARLTKQKAELQVVLSKIIKKPYQPPNSVERN